jgi:hypothetical protein
MTNTEWTIDELEAAFPPIDSVAISPPTIAPLDPRSITAAVQSDLSTGWFGNLPPDRQNDFLRQVCQRPGMVALADRPRPEWLRCLFALADAACRGADQAREIALQWCQTSRRFLSEEDFNRDWGSFKFKTGGITVGTLIDAANRDGMDLDPWRALASAATAPAKSETRDLDPGSATWRRKLLPANEVSARNHSSQQSAGGNHARPVVDVSDDINRVVDDVEAGLLSGRVELYQRGDQIVRVAPEQLKASDLNRPTTMRVVAITLNNFIEILTAAIAFQKSGKPCKCPRDVAAAYLERIGEWRLPILTGLCNAPTLRDDGTLLDHPGYDTNTGIHYGPFVAFPAIPTRPTKREARAALHLLIKLIETFPFVDTSGVVATGRLSASRSVALSAILSALMAVSLRVPLHGFDAPTAGTGKSKLVDIASVVANGRVATVIAQGMKDEETEKRIGAELIAGGSLISLDNCNRPVDCDLLNQALTQEYLRVRILGMSRNVTIPRAALFCANGNNLVLVGDLTRRAIVCRLDAQMERPELRQFKVDPVAVARLRRINYVAAALTMMRARVMSGPKTNLLPRLGSFEDWSFLVRDTLVWLGEPDPCDTMDQIRANDPVGHQLGDSLANGMRLLAADLSLLRTLPVLPSNFIQATKGSL